MKKLFAAAAVLATVVAAPAFAASTSTAATVVYAQIAPVCTISSQGSAAIALSGSSPIGNVSATCNNAAGFTASVTSLNNGVLKDQDNSANNTHYGYQLSVAGLPAFTPSSSGFQLTSDQLGGSAALINGVTVPATVNVGAPSGPAYAGTYQDTLTFTLTAN